jgi:hypothetical protein
MDTAVGLAGEQLALHQGMEQLAHNLQRQDNYLCTFTEGTLREVRHFTAFLSIFQSILACATVYTTKQLRLTRSGALFSLF